MKKIIAILFVVFLLFAACSTDTSSSKNKKEWKLVNAPSGLRMRKDKSTAADAVALIPDLAAVQVLEKEDKIVTIGGKKGSWQKVRWNNKEGWAFGAFMQKADAILSGKNFVWHNQTASGDTVYAMQVLFSTKGKVSFIIEYGCIPASPYNIKEIYFGKYRLVNGALRMSLTAISTKVTRDAKSGSGKEIVGTRKKVALQKTFRIVNGALVSSKLTKPIHPYLRKHLPVLKAGTILKLQKPVKKK